MGWYDHVIAGLKEKNVDFVAYLPDSTLWPLLERIENDDAFDAVLVTREEEAVGVLSGAWMGGRRGALICQTSGLANALNAIGSLGVAWKIPFIGIVSRRGNFDEHNLSQVPPGYGMPGMLESLGVRNAVLDGSGDLQEVVEMTARSAFSTEEPYVLMFENTLTGGKA
jgi:sulfopyruvate decarboxylase alpha subunit